MKRVKYICFLALVAFGSINICASESIEIDCTDTGMITTNVNIDYNIIPGSVIKKKIVWTNSSSKSQKLYIDVMKDDELLNKSLIININYKDNLLFEKSIDQINTTFYLGEFAPEKGAGIDLEIFLPETAGNEIRLSNSKIKIIFMTEEKMMNSSNVKTGDNSNARIFILMFVGSLIVGSLVIKRSNKYEET